MENIKIKKLSDKAIIPTRGSQYSAGFDLYACIPSPVFINPHETVKIGTGLSLGFLKILLVRFSQEVVLLQKKD